MFHKIRYNGDMEKKFFLAVVIPALLFAACVREGSQQTDSVSGATARRGPPAPILLEGFMPGAMADGIVKIAVLVNLEDGDNSRQFIEGCVAEGRSMGFIVDSFVSGGDEKRCRELAAGITRADYDGLIFSYGDVGFSYDILQPAAEKGMRIVTFEALPYQDGKSIRGLIATFRDDYRLARLSLDTLLSYTHGGDGRPARVIRVGCNAGITFLDRRAWEFDQLKDEGKIIEAAQVMLDSLENPRSAAWEALAAVLPRFPQGTVDAVWVPWDEFAVGCAEALASAGRREIMLFSIGISNDDMRLMQNHAEMWIANTAVDPKLAGTVNMRILAAGLAGETLSDTFSFDPQLVKTADLNRAVNMANIAALVPDWGDGKGLFDHYQWMDDLKTAEGKYFRIAPPGAPPSRAPL